MAGLNHDTPIPSELRLHQKSRVLEIVFDNSERYELTFEFLRVFTPSADARGHAPGQETLQVGKMNIDIERVEPVGHYAIRPVFSDGHESGIYTWAYLYELGERQDALWRQYLDRLAAAGLDRDAPMGGKAGGAVSITKTRAS